MLEQLSVQNFALIEELDLAFTPGFNVLSGETGAGKSIIIGALGLLLGERGDASVIRTGSACTSVSAVVSIPDDRLVKEFLDQRGIEPENGRIILRRVIRENGRNSITLQGAPVTQRELKNFALFLFDVHGQHEHQSLLKPGTQRTMLDSYAKITHEVDELRAGFARLEKISQDIENISKNERERMRERDMLTYAVNEIEAAALSLGEDAELEKQVLLLSQSEQLIHSIEAARSAAGRALDQLRDAQGELGRAADIDTDLAGESQRVETMLYELEDVREVLRSRLEQVQIRPGELDELQERLHSIRKLEKKYGDSVEAVLQYAREAQDALEDLDHSDERRESLQAEYDKSFKELKDASRIISDKRKESAEMLQERITVLLRDLGMPHGSFHVSVNERKNEQGETVYRPGGMDVITFEISPNKGEPSKAIHKIASGGEISRIMLALKSVFARSDRIDTLIFDEIDAGIGGSVATNVGMHLADLGKTAQVICITHLASIAARANSHFVVDKVVSENRTATSIRRVEGEQRISEIARMLSGDSDQDTALAHARELAGMNHE